VKFKKPKKEMAWWKNIILTRNFVGLAYQGKDIVFKFIIKYSSLRDFGP
jgi:hypothetical protein